MAFFNEHCKEIEENNRMEKTSYLFKKIEDIKGRFPVRMVMIKDINGMDLTEAEVVKRWQEYTEELYQKNPSDLGNHDGVVTHLELDILEHEVRGP